MKTVMKKMFSLLLVAVLLVSAVPFAASAEEMIPLELEPGEYTVNDAFVNKYYTGSGTPTQYYVHNGALQGETFTAIVERDYFLVIEAFAEESTPEPEPEPEPEPPTPSVPSNPSNLICSVCDGAIVERGENKDRFCVACGMYEGDCFCNSNLPTTDDHSGQIQVFVGGDANITIWVNQNTRRMQDVIAQIPMAAPANYEVSWFWDASYTRPIDMNDSVPRRAFHIYVKHSPLYNGPVDELTIQFHLNYGSNKMGDPMMASFDAITGTVLKNVNPTRKYYKFAGWYQDAKCTKPVNWRVKISEYDHNGDDVVHLYAKWEYDESNNKKGEITLMIYLNGNTDSVAKVKDIEGYADDLVVSYGEVVKIVERYYKPISNRDDMDIDGLYTADTWNNGDYSKRNAVSSVNIKGNGDYIIYVMVRDAKAIPSSSNGAKADNSNPKTGDMIMTPVIVLGASATCLAVLFYLNKKRAY